MITVYGIKTCSTVKKARAFLENHDIEYSWVDFRESPQPDKVPLWLEQLGVKSMRNTSGGAYRALPAEKKNWEINDWLPRMQADPMLLKRPILEIDSVPKACGFKEETWRKVLGL